MILRKMGVLQMTKTGQFLNARPGDYIWSLQTSSGVCVGMYGLTYSLSCSKAMSNEEGFAV